MKLSLAIALSAASLAEGSFEKIAGYKPGSQVTDHCAVDLDQLAIETQLAKQTDESFEAARKIYNEGGNSKSYAQVSLTTPLSLQITKGDSIMGRNTDGGEVSGKAFADYPSGTQTINILYETSDVQDNYMECQVGGLTVPNLKGCFEQDGTLNIGGQEYPYTYTPESDNKNDRTIAKFSKGAEDKMLKGCPGCPYTDFKYFNDYYGTPDYAHQWVEAAFAGESTKFSRGNADFSKYGFDGREQAIKKGSAYMNVFMYVIREFEDALDDCKRGILEDNYNSVHAWDEGVCFYTGSIEGQDGVTDDGKLLHQLADKRCENFMTCGPDGVDEDGMSKVNYDLLDLFAQGNAEVDSGNCQAARQTTKKITAKMYVPMIQGTLRYAYKVDKLSGGETEKAEGAIFAASVLPRVHAANPQAAQIIYDNMKVGATSTNSAAVKNAFESVYSEMGIDCADVGGLWNEATKDYYPGYGPCASSLSSTMSSSATLKMSSAMAMALGVVGSLLIAL